MNTSRAIHITLLAIFIGTGSTPDTSTEPTSASAEPTITQAGFEGDDERLAWVLEQFSAAGLALNDVEIRFFSEPSACNGNRGTHRMEGETHVASVCGSPAVGRKRTLLHELAHVWVAQHVDEALREDFMRLRAVTTWRDHDIDWAERGTEQAAEIVAWGIGDHPCWHVPTAISNRGEDALTEAFHLLTGMAPRCDTDTPEPAPASANQILS